MASQNIGAFDIDQLFVIFGARRLQGWPPSGAIVSVTKQRADEVSAEEGVDGEVAIYKSKGRLYTASITLMRTSAANGYLWDVLQAQRNQPGIPFLQFSVSYEQNQMVAARACIASAPSHDWAADSLPSATWTLLLPNYDGQFRGLSIDGPSATILGAYVSTS